jgi:hypothetical protein
MTTLEDYIEHINYETAGLANAVNNIYQTQKKFVKNISPIHNPDELPLFTGNQYQIQELMDRLGTYNSLMLGGGGDIPNVVYDNTLSYYNKGRPAQIIGGLESEDRTPVGTVAHPAPLDITSCGYWTPLIIQFGERLYEAALPKVEISNEFMNDISIAKVMAEATRIEREETERSVQPTSQSETKMPITEPINHGYNINWKWKIPGYTGESEKKSVTSRKTRTSRKYEKRKPKEDKGKKTVQDNSTSNTYILPGETPPIHDQSKEYIV